MPRTHFCLWELNLPENTHTTVTHPLRSQLWEGFTETQPHMRCSTTLSYSSLYILQVANTVRKVYSSSAKSLLVSSSYCKGVTYTEACESPFSSIIILDLPRRNTFLFLCWFYSGHSITHSMHTARRVWHETQDAYLKCGLSSQSLIPRPSILLSVPPLCHGCYFLSPAQHHKQRPVFMGPTFLTIWTTRRDKLVGTYRKNTERI